MVQLKAKILLIEEDVNLGTIIKNSLEVYNFYIVHKENDNEGIQELKSGNWDILLLDLKDNGMDNLPLIREIKNIPDELPIIYIATKTMKPDKQKEFRQGVDEYVTKPFNTGDLRRKINTVFRRNREKFFEDHGNGPVKIGTFTFDYSNHLLSGANDEYRLTTREADLLYLLSKNMNKVLHRETALKAIWGENDYFMGRSMDVYIAKLRKLLRHDPDVSIVNVHSIGFILEVKSR